MDKLKEAFRSGIRKRATRSVNDGGLGLEDDEAIERYVDLVEKEADQLALSLAAQTEGDVEKSAAMDNIQDELDYYLVKRAKGIDPDKEMEDVYKQLAYDPFSRENLGIANPDNLDANALQMELIKDYMRRYGQDVSPLGAGVGAGVGALGGKGLAGLLGGGSLAQALSAIGGAGAGGVAGNEIAKRV